MAAFETWDLGKTLATAEGIKQMRRQSAFDTLREQATRGQIASQDQSMQINASQEKRAETQYNQEQQVAGTKLLNAAAAEIAQDPSDEVLQRWLPQLDHAGVKFGANPMAVPPEVRQKFATQLFKSTSAALTALNPKGPEDLVQTTDAQGKAVYTPKSQAPGQHPYVQPSSVEYRDAGDRLIPVDSKTGQVKTDISPIKKGTPPGQAFSQDSVETTAKLISDNQIPMLTGFALKSPWGQAVVERVGQMNPDYQGGVYGSKASAMRAFSSGTESRTVRSLNVAISHLGTLSDLANGLENKDLQILNKASNAWKTQTGSPAPTSFTSARDIVANEVVKAVTASGGSLADRQEAQAQIQAAAGPKQLAGVIKTWKQLLGGQLGGLKQQYEQGTGQNDFHRFLSPEVQSQLGGQENSAAPATATGSPVRVNSPEEAMKLPSGTQFVTPDGRIKVRP